AFRTQFTPPATQAATLGPMLTAPPPPDNLTLAPRKAKLNGCQMGCLVVFGLFAALILLGSLVGGSRGSSGVEENGPSAQADRDRFKQVLESSGAGGVVLSIARGISENDVR